MPRKTPTSLVAPFFESRGWKPFTFQKQTWKAFSEGKSGLIHAPTGLGKTLAVWLAPLAESIAENNFKGCQVLWITPLRALALDTQKSLEEPLESLGLNIEVALRTGDSSSYQKSKLNKKIPYGLITTPESLSLFLTHENFRDNIAGLKMVVVDEWHELIGTKRGVQTELCLARLKSWFSGLRIWGLSATLGNTEQAKDILLGKLDEDAVIISGAAKKRIEIETLLPSEVDRFPWSGHIGTRLARKVITKLEVEETTLLFTNTRSQTEIWYQELMELKPEWHDELAMHHGSLDREERNLVEQRLREGKIRCVVCTSSLDLGVDFSPVSQVIQVGSPKGIARLMQRAGRSGHSPGGVSKLICVPSNAIELVEFAAARDSIKEKRIESKWPLLKPLDVLVQHVITICIGEPMVADDLKREIKSSYAYHGLTDEEWKWVLDFVMKGGKALSAYPNFRKVVELDGKLTIEDKKLVQIHRFNIGTITSHQMVSLISQSGRRYGSVEESFVSRLKKGSSFIFGGHRLEIVRLRQNKATVRKATKKSRGEIPIWAGGRMPLSTELSHAVAQRLQSGNSDTPEMKVMEPILKIQKEWSKVPTDKFLLLEQTNVRQDCHIFVYTFAGRSVNEGLGSLIAWRITQMHDYSIHVTMNDYGFSLTAKEWLPFEESDWRDLFSTEYLLKNLLACMNTAELARRQFRDIARVSGLVLQNLPRGRSTPKKDLMASSRLLYEVFERYDPDNLLMHQAKREILEGQLEMTRLESTMDTIQKKPFHFQKCPRLTPMAFPLWADRLQAHMHGEDAMTRLEKMLQTLEAAVD
ncbi:MAG: ligase-associated DNA damage response DEXH box helicase [Verrucomicrobiota bacterium]